MDRKKQLATFVKHVELLRRLPLVTKGQGVGWSLNVSKAKGMAVQVNLLDENDLRSFLLTFRMFISPKADIQLNKVYDTCFLRLKANNDLRDRLVEAREVWKEALRKVGEPSWLAVEQLPSGHLAGHRSGSFSLRCTSLFAPKPRRTVRLGAGHATEALGRLPSVRRPL